MKITWANEGERNNEGEYIATIDLENGKPPQVFKGKEHKEITDKLLVAQAHASQRIDELRQNRQPDKAKPGIEIVPTELSADDRFEIAQNMTDPAKAPEAIRRVVESAVGAPLASVSERLKQEEEGRRAQEVQEECIAFAQATPDFYQCKHNAQLIVNWLELKKLDITRNNCAIAFEDLKAAGLVVERPATPAAPPQEPPQAEGGLPPNATTRPRSVISSTGIRAGDSGTSEPARKAQPKYTLEDIEKMSAQEYSAKLKGEPGFAQLVDDLADKQRAANAARR